MKEMKDTYGLTASYVHVSILRGRSITLKATYINKTILLLLADVEDDPGSASITRNFENGASIRTTSLANAAPRQKHLVHHRPRVKQSYPPVQRSLLLLLRVHTLQLAEVLLPRRVHIDIRARLGLIPASILHTALTTTISSQIRIPQGLRLHRKDSMSSIYIATVPIPPTDGVVGNGVERNGASWSRISRDTATKIVCLSVIWSCFKLTCRCQL